jgi:methionine aminopeptidase
LSSPPIHTWPSSRAVKIRSERDIAGIREACRIGRQVLDAAHAAVRPGITTDEIDRIVSPCCRLQLLPSPCAAGEVFFFFFLFS